MPCQPALLVVCTTLLVVVLVIWVWSFVHIDQTKKAWCKSTMFKYTNTTTSVHTGQSYSNKLVDSTNKPIPCFYINLDRSQDRDQHIVSQTSRLGWTCHRVPAVDGKQPGQLDIIARNDFLGMTNSELGCVASHLKAIHTAWMANLDYALILEDDVCFEFVQHWPDNLVARLLARTAKNIGVVQLAWFDDQRHPSTSYTNDFVLTDVPLGVNCCSACAYIVTRKGMRDILKVSMYPTNQTNQTNARFQLARKYMHQMRGQADFYLYDLTRRCVTGLPLFMPDNRHMVSTIVQSSKPGQCDSFFAQIVTNYALVDAIDSVDLNSSHKHKPLLLDNRPGGAYRLETVVSGTPAQIKHHKLFYAHSLVGQYFSRAMLPGKMHLMAKLVRNLQAMMSPMSHNAINTINTINTILIIVQPCDTNTAITNDTTNPNNPNNTTNTTNQTGKLAQAFAKQLTSIVVHDGLVGWNVALMHSDCTNCTDGVHGVNGATCRHVGMLNQLHQSLTMVGMDMGMGVGVGAGMGVGGVNGVGAIVPCQPADQLFVLACAAKHVVATDSQYIRMVRQIASINAQ
jgi:GR25 family glycosyltransferase involved in LPS biosynthesis